MSPLIGALVAILVFRRKMIPSVWGTSASKSILTLVVPFIIFGLRDFKEIGLNSLYTFLYLLYAFFEEVGWRGYLYSELNHNKLIHRLLFTTVLCFFWSWQTHRWHALAYIGGLFSWPIQFLFQMPFRPRSLVFNSLPRHHHRAVALYMVRAESQAQSEMTWLVDRQCPYCMESCSFIICEEDSKTMLVVILPLIKHV